MIDHPDYRAAKFENDLEAAERVIRDVATPGDADRGAPADRRPPSGRPARCTSISPMRCPMLCGRCFVVYSICRPAPE
jgi:hypothetical protein